MSYLVPRFNDAKGDRDLTDSALRLYLHLVEDLSPVEWRPVKQLALASQLGVGLRTVERDIATLLRCAYIEAGTRVPGSAQQYRLVYSKAA